MTNPTRRDFLKTSSVCAAALVEPHGLLAQQAKPREPAPAASGSTDKETYETHAKGIRIVPGQWRPHYPFEQIAWISPAWPSQDYLWLDFPEAIFVGERLLYLSHVNPAVQSQYPDLPAVPWTKSSRGLEFERSLPNGIVFGGSVVKGGASTVEMKLHLHNGSDEPLREITLQTCLYLRAIREFADFTRDNKFAHDPDRGWITLTQARESAAGTGPYRIGWRSKGKPLADLPIIVTRANSAERWVVMSWLADTLSLVSNPNHPCMHADPQLKDLSPGESASIHGRIAFFEGRLEEFDHQSFLAP